MTTDAIEAALTGTSSGTPGASDASEAEPQALDAEVRTLRETLGQVQTDLKQTREQAKKAWDESRAAHSAADTHADRLSKQLVGREQRLFESLSQMGLDPKDVLSLQHQHQRDVELDELREHVVRNQVERQQAAFEPVRQRMVRDACEQLGVDPTDQRLDTTSPRTFYASLKRIAGEDGLASALAETSSANAQPREDDDEKGKRERRARSAREDLEVLGGGGGGVIKELPDDADELWKLAKKQTKSLRGK